MKALLARVPACLALLVLVLAAAGEQGGSPALAGSIPSEEADEAREPGDRHETIRIGNLTVAVWQPSHGGSEQLPLIVYSPGFTACATASVILTSALAEAGYIVAAPEHADSACAGGAFVGPEAPFGKPQEWSDKTYRQRGRDIAAVIDGLKADARWAPRIDAARIGLIGHSLGGHVALALAGAFPSWKRDDIKAVVACAPLIGPLLAKGKLGNIHIPVMYQAGTRDAGTAALIKKKGGAYDRTPSATFAEFEDATHFAWSGGAPALQPDIAAVTIAYFDAKLKGKPLPQPKAASVTVYKSK